MLIEVSTDSQDYFCLLATNSMEHTESKRKKDRRRMAMQLPPDLHRGVKLEVNSRFERGEKATQGDILLEAWEFYTKHKTNHKNEGENPANHGPADQPIGLRTVSAHPPREAEQPEVARLRKILASGHAVAIEAIQRNLVAFNELIDRASEQGDIHAGATHLPEGEMELIHKPDRIASRIAGGAQRLKAESRALETVTEELAAKHSSGTKKSGPTQKRTGRGPA
jgi:hypothetical protein